MNAAARALQQGSVFHGDVKWLLVSRSSLRLFALMWVLLVSAVTVIYVKNDERRLFSDLQNMHQQMDHYQVEHGQLMLEQSTWAAPARIQRVSQKRFGMQLPDPHDITMVAE